MVTERAVRSKFFLQTLAQVVPQSIISNLSLVMQHLQLNIKSR